CPGGRFRPKLLKEMRRVAWLAKCLQSAEIRASPVKRSPDASGAQIVHRASSIGDASDLKENVGRRLLVLIPNIIIARGGQHKTIQLTLLGRCDIRNHTVRRFCMVPGLTRPCHPLLAVLLTLAAAIPLHADVTGSILGIVTDSSGAVLANVQVIATNLDTNLSRTVSSDSTGEYRILALPVGHYKVESMLTGFQKFLATGIDLTVNEQHRLDIVMQVGGLEQAVEVNATAIQTETTSSQLGEVIEEKKLLTLPLNGRSYIDLLGLQAGVIPVTASSIQQDRAVSGGLSAGNLSVNGQRETANAFLVNGGDVSENRNLGSSVIPNLDAVAEFRLITNSF